MVVGHIDFFNQIAIPICFDKLCRETPINRRFIHIHSLQVMWITTLALNIRQFPFTDHPQQTHRIIGVQTLYSEIKKPRHLT